MHAWRLKLQCFKLQAGFIEQDRITAGTAGRGSAAGLRSDCGDLLQKQLQLRRQVDVG